MKQFPPWRMLHVYFCELLTNKTFRYKPHLGENKNFQSVYMALILDNCFKILRYWANVDQLFYI